MLCASSFLTGGAEHDEQESSLAATPGSSSLRVDEDVSFTFKQEAVGGLGDVQVIGLGTGNWNMSLFCTIRAVLHTRIVIFPSHCEVF